MICTAVMGWAALEKEMACTGRQGNMCVSVRVGGWGEDRKQPWG